MVEESAVRRPPVGEERALRVLRWLRRAFYVRLETTLTRLCDVIVHVAACGVV
jgi:hypothetical protein